MSSYCTFCQISGHSTSSTACPKKKNIYSQLEIHCQYTLESTTIWNFINELPYIDSIVAHNYFKEGMIRLNTRRIPIDFIRGRIFEFIGQRRNLYNQEKIHNIRNNINFWKERIRACKIRITNSTRELASLGVISNHDSKMNITIQEPVESIDFVCPVCIESTQTRFIATTGCNHQFCVGCMFEQIDRHTDKFPPCALCRTPIESIDVPSNFVKTTILKAIK